jgi:YVTN family beta-propeller protein
LLIATGCVAGAALLNAQNGPLPGMPPVQNPSDIYAADHAGDMSPAVRGIPERVYVPNSGSDMVDIIDPKTFKVIGHFRTGREPQHVVPSWDLKDLWVLDDLDDTAIHVDPKTGAPGEKIHVRDPYNMYYTPDGKYAIVVAEREDRLDFHDPHTMKVVEEMKVPCRGIDHMDFTADGRYLIASCEFSSTVLKVDVEHHKVIGTLPLEHGGMT